MKKVSLLLASLFATTALATSTLEQQFTQLSERRLERLDQTGQSLKKACFDQILTKLDLKNKVTKVEDLETDFGYGFQLKNGDVCLTTMNLRNLRSTTSCNSQDSFRTIQADGVCQEKP
ncbi:MAG: hypothetical protein ACAH59_09040 [Pseudobdellovibrionaceae bacterium]